jgi:hypothetical protein
MGTFIDRNSFRAEGGYVATRGKCGEEETLEYARLLFAIRAVKMATALTLLWRHE